MSIRFHVKITRKTALYAAVVVVVAIVAIALLTRDKEVPSLPPVVAVEE